MADKIPYRYHMHDLWNSLAMRLSLILFVFGLVYGAVLHAQDDEPLPVIKLSPVVRESESNPYAELPCDRLSAHRPQSHDEQRLLAERKQQCLDKYRQFIPADGVRR